MSHEIQELIKNTRDVIALPEISIQVNRLIDDPSSTAEDIGKVIAQDPMLSASLLKIANSPLYGLSTQIDSISRAITVLGTRAVRDLVISTEVSHAFDDIPNELISMRNFWRHSLYCGLLARLLAKHTRLNPDSMFISGLLHDIGQLIMFNRLPDKAQQAILLCIDGPEEIEMYQAEQKTFGFDHTQVGAELAREWKLPANIIECIEFHHDPTQAKTFPAEAALIHIANAAAVMAELNAVKEAELPEINPACWETTGLNMAILAETVEQAQQDIADIEAILFP